MRKLSNSTKAIAAVAAGAVVVASAGAAYAYYRSNISSAATSGTAAIATTAPSNVVATLKTGAAGLVPGGGAQNLVVTLTNNNPFAVDIDNKTLTLDFANATTPAPGCTNAVALLSAAAKTGVSHVFAKANPADDTDAHDVTFVVSMADSTDVNQQPCNGATLTIPVVASN